MCVTLHWAHVFAGRRDNRGRGRGRGKGKRSGRKTQLAYELSETPDSHWMAEHMLGVEPIPAMSMDERFEGCALNGTLRDLSRSCAARARASEQVPLRHRERRKQRVVLCKLRVLRLTWKDSLCPIKCDVDACFKNALATCDMCFQKVCGDHIIDANQHWHGVCMTCHELGILRDPP